MLYVPPILDLDGQCGDWTRDELGEMDHRFVAAVERAFELGLESRAAASATYAVNSKQRADEIAVELAWRFFRDAKFDVPAAAILVRCPGVAPERVREGIRRRFVSWIGAAR
jgi:hypothetical protein